MLHRFVISLILVPYIFDGLGNDISCQSTIVQNMQSKVRTALLMTMKARLTKMYTHHKLDHCQEYLHLLGMIGWVTNASNSVYFQVKSKALLGRKIFQTINILGLTNIAFQTPKTQFSGRQKQSLNSWVVADNVCKPIIILNSAQTEVRLSCMLQYSLCLHPRVSKKISMNTRTDH